MNEEEKVSLSELKAMSPANLLKQAEELEIENASTMRKGDMMFAILKEMAEDGAEISGDGVLELMQDGFGFLRSPESNYLPGPKIFMSVQSKFVSIVCALGIQLKALLKLLTTTVNAILRLQR